MNQPPLNPDALEAASEAIHAGDYHGVPDEEMDDMVAYLAVSAYLTAALPVVTGEQVNLAGWTCNGIHEPGDYSTCEECRDACDDLARFYNHMMQNPRLFKHWTGNPEVQS